MIFPFSDARYPVCVISPVSLPSSHWLFVREFLRAPWQTGAVAPSSRRLGAAMVEPIPSSSPARVVELGPGSGAVSGLIERRMAGQGRQLAVEVNPTFAARLAHRHPGLEVVQADARHLPALLASRGFGDVDVVVSSLPWAAFDRSVQAELMAAVSSVMSAQGVFVTFGYSLSRWTPPARRFRQLLHSEFDEVVIGRTIRLNIPPAFVYYARRPRTARDFLPDPLSEAIIGHPGA